MIIGLFIKNFKTYSGLTYIPLSNGDSFCGLIGENGIGKSSVLEALDCFFNGSEWNRHKQGIKSGTKSEYVIAPVFFVNINKLNLDSDSDFVEKIKNSSSSLKNKDKQISISDVNSEFYNHIDEIKRLYPNLFQENELIYVAKDLNDNFADDSTSLNFSKEFSGNTPQNRSV
jgi:recombinational DNA repair ATPase RecF